MTPRSADCRIFETCFINRQSTNYFLVKLAESSGLTLLQDMSQIIYPQYDTDNTYTYNRRIMDQEAPSTILRNYAQPK
jgi:hypothetical protein